MEEVHERLKRSSSSSLVLDIQSEDGTYRALETKADNTIELVPYNMLKRYTSASEMEIASNAVPMKEIGDGHEKSSSSSSVPFLQSQDGAYRTLETNAQSEEAYSTLEVFPYSTLEAVPYSTLEAAPYSTLEMVPYNMPKCYRSASEMQWTNYDTPVPSKDEQVATTAPVVPSGAGFATAEATHSTIYGLRKRTFWIVLIVVATLIVIGAVIGGVVGGRLHKSSFSSTPIAAASTATLVRISNVAFVTGVHSSSAALTPSSIPNLAFTSTTPTPMTASTSTTETSTSTSPGTATFKTTKTTTTATTPSPITASPITASPITASPINASPINASPITTTTRPTTSTTSTTSTTIPQSAVCIGGTGPGNYAGLCSFSCHYAYCPPGPCTCTQSGSPVPTPPTTGVIGLPLTDEDDSYLGLCSFCCNHGYCPPTACRTG